MPRGDCGGGDGARQPCCRRRGGGGGALVEPAALAALLYGLMTFTVEPLYVFTEWVPENIVAWSSLRDVFWNLTSSAAQLVKVGMPQMRRIEFAGGLLRWGCLLAAWAALLLKRRARAKR